MNKKSIGIQTDTLYTRISKITQKSSSEKLSTVSKLKTHKRAIAREKFNFEQIQRAIEKENQKFLHSLHDQKIDDQIRKEKRRVLNFKARKMPKYKPLNIQLPKRRIRVSSVPIYERGIQQRKAKEQYLQQYREYRHLNAVLRQEFIYASLYNK